MTAYTPGMLKGLIDSTPDVSILLNLAECQEKLGRTASAWATWREARAVAAEAHKNDDEAMAADRARALEPRLTRLTIVVPPTADLPDLEIRRDGAVVPRAAWGSATPVDPGVHTFEEQAPGRKSRRVDVVVDPGAVGATATMMPLESEAAPVIAVVAPVPPLAAEPFARLPLPPQESTSGGSGQAIAGWVVGGLGVAAAVAGIAVAVEGQGQHTDALAAATACIAAGHCPTTSAAYMAAQSEESSASTTKIEGYATLGAGGALLVTGVVLLATAHSGRSHASNVALQAAQAVQLRVSTTGAGAGFTMGW